MINNLLESSTKQRILTGAARLFAQKGFTETSIRELAEAVGLNSASLYYHFPSKNSILEQLLEDYSSGNINVYDEQIISDILHKNPTTDGILACMQTTFPADKAEYYAQVLFVLLQEQLRNPIVRNYISENIILRAEQKVKLIINVLKELGVIRQDTDPDYWMKATSCFSYSFATRMMLGIGDNTPDFTGKGMAEMHRYTFDLMLEKCGAQKSANTQNTA